MKQHIAYFLRARLIRWFYSSFTQETGLFSKEWNDDIEFNTLFQEVKDSESMSDVNTEIRLATLSRIHCFQRKDEADCREEGPLCYL